jgi:dTDP-4-amino-4,6-dideoxygalactose transaminase
MTRPRIYLSPPHVGGRERGLLREAFDSNWIAPLGPHVDGFEREMAERLGVSSAAALSSGTAALHIALLLVGVQRGDRVICSDLTFAASANAIAYCGAEPVFIDCEADTWNIDPDLLEEELASMARQGLPPKAVVVVDLYGHCAAYDRLEEICSRHEVPLIEDAAEALGSTFAGRAAGSFGQIGVLSFNGNKIITTSGGGMLVSQDAAAIARARFLATQARDPAPHYEHSTIGYNYRMSNLLAAVGRGQLEALDDRVAARRRVFGRYREVLSRVDGLTFPADIPGHEPNRWLTCMVVDPATGVTPEQIRLTLELLNIEARPIWKPMHMQPVFSGCRIAGGEVSRRLFETGLCLPSGSDLMPPVQDFIIEEVLTCFGGIAATGMAQT